MSSRGRPPTTGSQRKVRLYDAEKRQSTGNGYYVRSFNIDPEHGVTNEQVDEALAAARAAQSLKNQRYREHKKLEALRKPIVAKPAKVIEKPAEDPLEAFGDQLSHSIDSDDSLDQSLGPEERQHVPGTSTTRAIEWLDPETPPSHRIVSMVTLALDPGTGNSTALIGSSKQGKSTCMMHLYRKHYADAKSVNVLFATNPQIALYTSKKLISVPTYDPRFIQMAQSINRRTNNAYPFLFMIDDIVDRRDDVVLKQLILTYRNSNISSIICLQYTNLLAKVSRANMNNLLLFGFNSDEAIEIVCKQFLSTHLRSQGVLPEHWNAYYRKVTANHGFFYVRPATNEVTYHRL